MLAVRIARVGVPLLVALSVTLLGVLAVVTIVEPGLDAAQQALFVGGIGTWMLGIGWGVAVNSGRAAAA